MSNFFRTHVAKGLARKGKGDPFAALRNGKRLDVAVTVKNEKTQIQDQARRLIEVANKESYKTQAMNRYVNRLTNLISPLSGPDLTDLEQEVQQEMAEALGRAGIKVDTAYLSYEISRREFEKCKNQETLRQVSDAREVAIRARQELIIHRSCMGLNNSGLGSVYRIWPNLPQISDGETKNDARCPIKDCEETLQYWKVNNIEEMLKRIYETENLQFEIPKQFPSVSSFLRPIEYLAKHLAKEMPKHPETFVREMIHHQTEIYEHALNVIRERPMGKRSPDAVEAGRLAVILNGDKEEKDEVQTSISPQRRYDAFRTLNKGKYSKIELKEKWHAYKRTRNKSRLVQLLCVEAESESVLARGTQVTFSGRKRLFDMGSRIRSMFGPFDDVRVWTARHTPALHGAESLVHGMFRITPMPNDTTRIRMRHEYTKNNTALVYHCNLALSDFGIRALTRTVPILTTRGPLDRSVGLSGFAGALGVRALLSAIIQQIQTFDSGPGMCLNQQSVSTLRNQFVGYVGGVDAIRGLYKVLKIENMFAISEPLSFEISQRKRKNATQKYRKVRIRRGKEDLGNITFGKLCRIRDSL